MKKKSAILFILFSITLLSPLMHIRAQNEMKITVPISEKFEGISNDILSTYPKSDSTFSNFSLYLDLYRINPLLNLHRTALRYNPSYLNYDMSKNYKLSKKLFLAPYNRQTTYLGLGHYNNIGASVKWTPVSRFSIENEAFLSLQYGYTLFSKQISYGYNLRFNYDITHNLLLTIYGQYMINESKDPFLNYSNEFPKSNVGVFLHYTPKENSKIGIGMEYQYDQYNQKWKPEAKGKVSLGF